MQRLDSLIRRRLRALATHLPLTRPESNSVHAGIPFAVRPLPQPARRRVVAGRRPPAVPVSTVLLLLLTVLVTTLTVELHNGWEQQAALRADLAATAARATADEAALRAELAAMGQLSQQQQSELASLSQAYATRARQAAELRRALDTEREMAAQALAATTVQAGLAEADGETWRQRAGEQQAEREALAGQLQQREAELAAMSDAMAALQRQADATEALAARVRQTLGLPKATGPAGGDAPQLVAAEAVVPAEHVVAVESRLAAAHRELVAADRALQARLVALRSLATAGQPARLSAAAIAIAPTGWPVAGSISSPFGPRSSPIDEQVRFHSGVDIVVNVGTAVKATQAGEVTLAGPQEEYGLLIVIRHAGGFETLYGHNSQVLVRAGQTVERGQVIARSGNTGVSTGPHLHYEVRYQGKGLDPAPLLKAGGA